MALGVNLAKFEFPSYFNLFMQRKRCTLVVDSLDAERNIGSVFNRRCWGRCSSGVRARRASSTRRKVSQGG